MVIKSQFCFNLLSSRRERGRSLGRYNEGGGGMLLLGTHEKIIHVIPSAAFPSGIGKGNRCDQQNAATIRWGIP